MNKGKKARRRQPLKKSPNLGDILLIDTGPFFTEIIFALTIDQVRKAFERADCPYDEKLLVRDAPASTFHMDRSDDGVGYTTIVYLDYTKAIGRTKTEVHALICHEIIHVLQDIRRKLGNPDFGVEPEAYLMQYIFLGIASYLDDLIKENEWDIN